MGNPAPGDLLGAVNGRTFTGDTPETENLQRSTLMIDHTFVKAQRDNGQPAATYTVAGNGFCSGGIGPITAVSRKTHAGAGTFDIDLYRGKGIECRRGQGVNFKDHQIVITFGSALPISVSSVNVSPGPGKTADIVGTPAINGNQLTVNLTNVANAQTLFINLIGLSDGKDTGNISIPASFLLADVNQSKSVDSGDVLLLQRHNGQALPPSGAADFKRDLNLNGFVDSGDVSLGQKNNPTLLPAQ